MSKIYGLAPDRETLEVLARAAAQRGVQVFAKVLWGDPAKKLTEAVHKVPLQWLVVGNRRAQHRQEVLHYSIDATAWTLCFNLFPSELSSHCLMITPTSLVRSRHD